MKQIGVKWNKNHTDEDTWTGVLLDYLINEAEDLDLVQIEPDYVQKLSDVVVRFNRNLWIEPTEWFLIAVAWTGIEKPDSSDLSRIMSGIAQKPRPKAKLKNLPEEKELVSAVADYKSTRHKIHGVKRWLAGHFNVNVSTINRAAEEYDLDDA